MIKELRKILRKEPEAALGIDISDKKIDIAQVEKTDSGIRLVNFMRSPLPQGAVEEGLIMNRQVVSNVIKNMLTGLRINYCFAAVSVQGKGTVISLKKYPYMQMNKLKGLFKDEAGNYIAFAGSDILTDGVRLEEISEEGERKLRVLFGLAKKEIIDSYTRTIKRTECEIASIGLGGLEDLRALHQIYSDSIAILVVVEYVNTYIFLIDRGNVKSVYTGSFGSENVEEGEEFISRLSPEIDRVIMYGREFEGIISPEKIVLAGELGGLENSRLVNALEEEFGLKTEIGNPFTGITTPPDFNEEEFQNLTRGLGLAIRAAGVKGLPADINLLPAEEMEKRVLRGELRKFFIGLFIVLAVVFLGFVSIQLALRHVEKQTVLAGEILDRPTPVTTELAGFEKGFKNSRKELERTGEIIEEVQRRKWGEFLNEIKLIIPKTARLKKIISGQEGLIELTGEAVSQEAVFDFEKNLKESPFFRNIELRKAKDINKPGMTLTEYTIKGKLFFYREKE